MRKLLLIGAGMVALAGTGVALAQAPAPPPGAPPQAALPPPPGADGPRGGGHGPMHWRGGPGGPDMRGGDMRGGDARGGPDMRMMQRSKAARFHFSRGDASVDVHCAADEPTRACVDAAVVLLDKLAPPAR